MTSENYSRMMMRARDGRLGGSNLVLALCLLIAAGCMIVGLWMAFGPWSVDIHGTSFGCSSPFAGRYLGGSQDAMAVGAYTCNGHAGGRRLMAILFGGGGLIILFATTTWLAFSGYREQKRLLRRHTERSMSPS